MAGHSQFKNIMFRKGKQDKVRSKLFSKLGREITVAAKMGLPDPEMNPRLRMAIIAARAENMPRDNIERAIKKALGGDAENYDEVRYEGYGPGGVAVIVEALTDNRNRTGGAIRAAFVKHGGNMGSTGSVAHMFAKVGEIVYAADAGTDDAMLDAAIDAGADDVASDDSGHTVICAFEQLAAVSHALEKIFGEAEKARGIWKPSLMTEVNEDHAGTVLKLIATLDDDDDVQNVFANFEVSEEVMKKLTAA